VALIWAAAATIFYHDPQLQPLTVNPATGATLGGNAMVGVITNAWFPRTVAVVCVLGVISAAVTSGDTALRSARLIVADFLHFDQKPIRNRLLVAGAIFAVTAGVLVYSLLDAKGFDVIWRYFAWSNQLLAAVTLWAVTMYLYLRHKPYIIALVPAIFMTMVTGCFLFVAEKEGLGAILPHSVGYAIGGLITVLAIALFFRAARRLDKKNDTARQ